MKRIRRTARVLCPICLLLVLMDCRKGSVVDERVRPRDALLAAKQMASDANFRNDQPGMRDGIARLERLAADETIGAHALYWAGWTRWLLAASEIVAGRPAAATSTLDTAVTDLKRALEKRPDDADVHAVLAWSLVAMATFDPAKRPVVGPEIRAHRARALELAPRNPRVMIMDAGLTFYAPPERGGSQEKAVARWLEAMDIFEREKIADPVLPDWGRALAYGWLANLYLAMTPPDVAGARKMSAKALELRPDFWFVTTQVVPRLRDK